MIRIAHITMNLVYTFLFTHHTHTHSYPHTHNILITPSPTHHITHNALITHIPPHSPHPHTLTTYHTLPHSPHSLTQHTPSHTGNSKSVTRFLQCNSIRRHLPDILLLVMYKTETERPLRVQLEWWVHWRWFPSKSRKNSLLQTKNKHMTLPWWPTNKTTST